MGNKRTHESGVLVSRGVGLPAEDWQMIDEVVRAKINQVGVPVTRNAILHLVVQRGTAAVLQEIAMEVRAAQELRGRG